MCCPHCRSYWSSFSEGQFEWPPMQTDGNKRHFPVLDELYDGDESKPDARERLLSMLDDTEWTV